MKKKAVSKLLAALMVMVMFLGCVQASVYATEGDELMFDAALEETESIESAEEETAAPEEDETTESAEDETADSTEDEFTEPAGGETTAPEEDETIVPEEDETIAPAEDETTAPAVVEAVASADAEIADDFSIQPMAAIPETTFSPKVTVSVTGETPETDGTFTFKLERADNKDGVQMPENTTATITGSGEVIFDPITFTQTATATDPFKFTITQVDKEEEGYTYDDSVWTLTVQPASKKGLGGSIQGGGTKYICGSTTIAGLTGSAKFTNEYTAPVTATHALIYNANGGINAPASQTYTGDEDTYVFTVSDEEPEYSRTGTWDIVFKGWATAADAEEPAYFAGDEITVNRDEPVTLYAVYAVRWNFGFNFRLSVDPLEGSTVADYLQENLIVCYMITSPNDSVLYEGSLAGSDATVQLYTGAWTLRWPRIDFETPLGVSTITITSLSGYEYPGLILRSYETSFAMNGTGNGNQNSKDDFSISASYWYGTTVNFYSGGELIAQELSYKKSPEDAGEPVIVPMPDDREGYTFVCWTYDDGGDIVACAPGDSIVPEPGVDVMDIYALWTFEVTVDGETVTVNEGDMFMDLMLEAPTREGYTFTGWTVNGEEVAHDYELQPGDVIVSQWKKNSVEAPKEITVTMITGDGSVITVTYSAGQTIGTLPTPTRAGYTLEGWYYADGTKASPDDVLTADTTLTAKWTLDVTVDGVKATVYEGTTIANLAKPTKEGYTFAGWTVNGKEVADGYVLQPGDVIAAKWVESATATPAPTATPTPTATPEPTDTPETGDHSNMSLWLSLMCVTLLGIVVALRKSKRS